LLRGVRLGELVREGALIVLAGPPNAGKSSLFNALLGIERAIVHETPGTTRDAIEATIEVNRWPLRLVDTAGLRESADEIERTGVEVSRRYLAGAHLILVCAESRPEIDTASTAISALSSAPQLHVRTKLDLGGDAENGNVISLSARTRVGLDSLLNRIERTLDERYGSLEPDVPLLTRARHQAVLMQAATELESFRSARTSSEVPMAIAAVHLRSAVHALESLVGAVDVEDVLDRVFSSFSVGK
jgi:tRNA modification GTPase